MDSLIETGVDKLMELVKKKGKVTFQDASNELGVSPNLIEEWAEFLEEEGLINLDYKLTTPYISEKKLTKKDAEGRIKEFSGKKEEFIRKAETMLSLVEKESKELREIKEYTDKIRKEVGIDLKNVKGELSELERYEALKEDVHKKILKKEEEFKEKLENVTSQILEEEKKYEELLKSVKEEEERIEKEKIDAKSIEEKEGLLMAKLKEFEAAAETIRRNIKEGYGEIIVSEKNANELKKFANNIKKDIAVKKTTLFTLLGQREKKEKKIMELQDEIAKKISQTAKSTDEARLKSRKFREFFEKRAGISEIIDKLNKTKEGLKEDLAQLIRQSKVFSISSKEEDAEKIITQLDSKLTDIEKKRGAYESELKKFLSFIK